MRHLDSCDQIITVDDSGNICVTNGKEKLPFIQEDPSMLPTIKEEDNEPLPVKDVTLIKSAQDLEFETMTNETLQGDLSIYGYFLTSVPPYILAIFFTAVILVGLLETLPIIYIRIWVGVAPQERNYVFGLIPFGLLDAACNGFTVWYVMLQFCLLCRLYFDANIFALKVLHDLYCTENCSRNAPCIPGYCYEVRT